MVTLTGKQLVGARSVLGGGAEFSAVDPRSGAAVAPTYRSSTASDVAEACRLADAAFDLYRETALEPRSEFLRAIAAGIEGLGDELVARASDETGLPAARLSGERNRTCNQLRLFADVVSQGDWLDVCVDPALPNRKPQARPDIRRRQVALGPVAVFGSSNFPLAFSVAGGDTASALAAGCPVVVKAHAAHPGTSEMVGSVIQRAVADCGLPEGVFSLLYDAGVAVGGALVADSRIKAVGFTGSRRGGLALLRIAQQRSEPIPVYAEMSSINPVIILPHALSTRAAAIAEGFVKSLVLGAGQFCTNPGLVVAEKGPSLDGFLEAAARAIAGTLGETMLTGAICANYRAGVGRLSANPKVREIGNGQLGSGPNAGQAKLFAVAAVDFLMDRSLQQEVFGSASVIIECDDASTVRNVVGQLEGQLTCTLHMDPPDADRARLLLPLLERKAGRILVNGWPTGVEVCSAMIHGGPYPATTDSRTTSVGTTAIRRFLRPVCYQDVPGELLPDPLKSPRPMDITSFAPGATGHTGAAHA